jgi:hypothetical protein
MINNGRFRKEFYRYLIKRSFARHIPDNIMMASFLFCRALLTKKKEKASQNVYADSDKMLFVCVNQSEQQKVINVYVHYGLLKNNYLSYGIYSILPTESILPTPRQGF